MTTIKIKFIFIVLCIVLLTPSVFSQNNQPMIVIKTPAEYPGGFTMMYKFITENLNIGKSVDSCFSSTVYINFCVKEDGTLDQFKIIRSTCKELDNEVMRIFSMMPKWTPAIEADTKKHVVCYFTIPVKINLE